MSGSVDDAGRTSAFRTGLSAEEAAAAYLVERGFRIAARRWRCRSGEIDIVARRGALLVFVEVKARARLDDAAWSVTPRQRRRIAGAAAAWLAAHPQDAGCDMRFDAILIAPGHPPRHIAAAFDVSD
jgi:putative endonuclease